MKELQFIPDRLDDIQKELGISGFSGFLEDARKKTLGIIATDQLCADIFYHSVSPAAIEENIASLKNASAGSSPIKCSFFTEKTKKPVKVFRELFPSIAIVYYDECVHKDVDFRSDIILGAEQYNLVLLINYFDDESAARQFCGKLPFASKPVFLAGQAASKKTAEELFQAALIQPNALNSLKKMACCRSIKPLFIFLQEIFESENKTIQTRKLLNTQAGQISRKEEQGFNQNDLSTNIRQLLQKTNQELDKNFKLKYEELNKPNTGKFSKTGSQSSNQLKDFNKLDLAEKSEKVGISIDKHFTDNFLAGIKTAIINEISKDEPFLKISVDDLIAKVNLQLLAKGITPVNKEEVYAPFPDQQRLITSYSYISRAYTSELTKKGATEYFIALRDYIGIMMVATGLLAPLNLIASLSDEHSMFGFLKKLSTGIKIATAILTLALIVYGIFDLRKRIPRKREEEFEKEINKARESLLQESKRIFSESSRDWSANISVWIRDTTQNLSLLVDKNMKDIQTARLSKLNTDKNQQFRMQQSIDLIQRNIQSAERIKDTMATRFRDFVSETEKELKL
jgi:hypothetical protein